MDRDVLFSNANASIFGGRITLAQKQGIGAILDGWDKYGYGLDTALAYVLATPTHETGKRMVPVRETFATSDAQAKSRLDAAWKKGQMKWVKSNYWKDGWFGRGLVQITHEDNYAGPLRTAVLKEFPGKDIHADPSLALDPQIAVFLLIEGITKGDTLRSDFTKYALEDFINDSKTDYLNARKTVNPAETDSFQKVADYALLWENAIRAARTAAGEEFKGPGLNLYDGRRYLAVEHVQELLKQKGYSAVGIIDGRWGSSTRGAVLAFRADNGLPLTPTITDDAFLAALAIAGNKPIAPERAEATVADLRQEGSKTILHADKTQIAAVATAGFAGLGAVNKGLDAYDQYSTTLKRVQDIVQPVSDMITTNWPLILGSVAAFVAWQAWKIKKAKLEAHQKGDVA